MAVVILSYPLHYGSMSYTEGGTSIWVSSGASGLLLKRDVYVQRTNVPC